MDVNDLSALIAEVGMMGGDRLGDLLAQSEIRAIARTVIAHWPDRTAAPAAEMLAPTLDFLVADQAFPVQRGLC